MVTWKQFDASEFRFYDLLGEGRVAFIPGLSFSTTKARRF